MKQRNDPLSVALEELRNRPIVNESRDFARRWERDSARTHATRKVVLGALGAVCVAAYAAFALLPSTMNPFTRDLIQTDIGETRSVALEDGSHIMLDTNSRIRLAYTEGARDVQLLEGQAHFEVAKDHARPFRVRTKSAEIVAVGTAFDVAALSARTTVTLIEGRVKVRALTNAPQAHSRAEVLAPGQQIEIASDGHFLGRKTVALSSVTAWQRGTIVLDDVPLSEALSALNRYSTTRIVIPDARLQSRRVSGTFLTGDVDTQAISLQRYFGLREQSRSETEIVLAGD